MKVRFEVDSAQIGMAAPDALLVKLAESGFIEVENFGGGFRRLTLKDWAVLWEKSKAAENLVKISKSK